MSWLFIVLCLDIGVCIEPAFPAEQQELINQESRLADPNTPGCRTNLMSTCGPLFYGI